MDPFAQPRGTRSARARTTSTVAPVPVLHLLPEVAGEVPDVREGLELQLEDARRPPVDLRAVGGRKRSRRLRAHGCSGRLPAGQGCGRAAGQGGRRRAATISSLGSCQPV